MNQTNIIQVIKNIELSGIHKLLVIVGLVLLLAACNSKQPGGQLVLIVEGLPPQDSLNIAGSGKAKKDLIKLLFLNSQTILDRHSYNGGCDTFALHCTKPFFELAIGQRAFLPERTSYTLLRVGDTVRLSFLSNGDCFVESLTSPTYTPLYNLDSRLFSHMDNSAKRSLNDIVFCYIMLSTQKNSGSSPFYTNSLDSAVNRYHTLVHQYGQLIDSLKQAGSLPPTYESYYRYRMGLLDVQPLLMERQFSITPPQVSPALTAPLNDSLCGYISYWYAMKDFREPLVRPSGNGELPRFEYVDSTEVVPVKTWTPDQRGVFDRLGEYTNDIPPHTLNLMRYLCLDRIQNSIAPKFPKADKQLYLSKYRKLTADYLDFNYASLDSTAGFPFRFFLFLAECCLCMRVLFAVYLLLRKRLNFGKRRVFLLLCLILSFVVSLTTQSAQLRLVERTATWASVFNTITHLLFCLYLLGCIYLLYELLSWLWKVRRMHRDSWQIPSENHTLYILMYEDSKPTIFGRSIFFCWDDWWHPTDRDSRDRVRDSQHYRIRHGHMFDSVLLGVLRTLCWANPLLRTYNMELQRVNDMAASHYIYSNRIVHDYTATEEMQQLQSGLVSGLAGSGHQANGGTAGRRFSEWLHGVKYQLAIFVVLLLIAAILIELFTTIGVLSKSSLFG